MSLKTNSMLFMAAFVGATTFFSCSNDDDDNDIKNSLPENAVKFTIANLVMQNNDSTNTTDVYKVDFANNDTMGVHVLNGTYPKYIYEPMNVLYTVSNNGNNLSTTVNPITLTDSVVSLLAYYPYKTPYDPAYELKAFAVKVDQSEYANFKKSNFMNAVVSGCSSENLNVKLSFSPRTALVFVHFNGSNAKDIKQVTIPAMTKSSMSAAPSEPANVKLYKYKEVSDTDVVWAAFLAAQTFEADTKIEYTDGTQKFESDAIAGATIASGKVNSFVVK